MIGMPGGVFFRVNGFKMVLEEGRIANNKVILMIGIKVPDIFLDHPYPIPPWAGFHIFLSLEKSILIKFNGIDHSKMRTLCQHKGEQRGAGSNVKKFSMIRDGHPCAKQACIRGYLHGTTILLNTKLFELKVRVRQSAGNLLGGFFLLCGLFLEYHPEMIHDLALKANPVRAYLEHFNLPPEFLAKNIFRN